MSGSRKNKAVALKYNVEEDVAPVIIAAGYGEVAQRIIDIAEKKGIPVFRDDSAASLMCMLEVGSNIPAELYEVVAAIYCQLLEVSSQIKNREEQKAAAAPRAQLPRRRRRSPPPGEETPAEPPQGEPPPQAAAAETTDDNNHEAI